MDIERQREVESAVEGLLLSLGVDLDDPNFKETPRRISTYYLEHFLNQDEVDRLLDEIARTSFPSRYSGMIVQSGIRVNGICPHHGLPVLLTIGIGYIPSGQVIGLSKLTRVADLIGRQPNLQENVTLEIAETLRRVLHTQHVAVVIEGVHTCMTLRGVRAEGTVTTTAEMMGHFSTNHNNCKDEFMNYLNRSRS